MTDLLQNPSQVCAVFSFCQPEPFNYDAQPPVSAQDTQLSLAAPDYCTDCKAFIGDAQSILKNATVQVRYHGNRSSKLLITNVEGFPFKQDFDFVLTFFIRCLMCSQATTCMVFCFHPPQPYHLICHQSPSKKSCQIHVVIFYKIIYRKLIFNLYLVFRCL